MYGGLSVYYSMMYVYTQRCLKGYSLEYDTYTPDPGGATPTSTLVYEVTV